MRHLLIVFLGGGAGSICRYGLSLAMPPLAGWLPIATLTANVSAALVVGVVSAVFVQHPNHTWRLLLVTGFCGGFSTFSTFSNEVWQLLRKEAYMQALVYASGSLLLSVAGIAVGFYLVRWAGFKL